MTLSMTCDLDQATLSRAPRRRARDLAPKELEPETQQRADQCHDAKSDSLLPTTRPSVAKGLIPEALSQDRCLESLLF